MGGRGGTTYMVGRKKTFQGNRGSLPLDTASTSPLPKVSRVPVYLSQGLAVPTDCHQERDTGASTHTDPRCQRQAHQGRNISPQGFNATTVPGTPQEAPRYQAGTSSRTVRAGSGGLGVRV